MKGLLSAGAGLLAMIASLGLPSGVDAKTGAQIRKRIAAERRLSSGKRGERSRHHRRQYLPSGRNR